MACKQKTADQPAHSNDIPSECEGVAHAVLRAGGEEDPQDKTQSDEHEHDAGDNETGTRKIYAPIVADEEMGVTMVFFFKLYINMTPAVLHIRLVCGHIVP